MIPSAVLLPIFVKEMEYHLIFTRRTNKVKVHKGQISFPGGAYENEDAGLLDTALRESAEEIGLEPSDVELLGEMDDISTINSGFAISPFVGFIPWPYEFRLDPWEVDSLIKIPIPALLSPDCRHRESQDIWGEAIPSFSYHYQDDIIWGASARILYQFLDIYSQALDYEGSKLSE
ncbi:NUDIX hydrolase [Chloroflexota bacterium]